MTNKEETLYIEALKEVINSAMTKFVKISENRGEDDKEFFDEYFCYLALQGKEHELSRLMFGFVSGSVNHSDIAGAVIGYFNDLEIDDACKLIVESYS